MGERGEENVPIFLFESIPRCVLLGTDGHMLLYLVQYV
jgi:hypothetical protein